MNVYICVKCHEEVEEQGLEKHSCSGFLHYNTRLSFGMSRDEILKTFHFVKKGEKLKNVYSVTYF
jgi:hypothetical protein